MKDMVWGPLLIGLALGLLLSLGIYAIFLCPEPQAPDDQETDIDSESD